MLSYVVAKADTAISAVQSSNAAPVYGQSFDLSATVTSVAPGGGVPTGTVTFFDEHTVLGTAMLDNAGLAVFTVTTQSRRLHSITAQYDGSTDYNASPVVGPQPDREPGPRARRRWSTPRARRTSARRR